MTGKQAATEKRRAELVRKAREFNQVFTEDRPYYDLLEDFGDLCEALQATIVEILMDESETDKAGKVDGALAQYSEAVQTWLARAEQSDTWEDLSDRCQELAARGSDYSPYSYMMSEHPSGVRRYKGQGQESAPALQTMDGAEPELVKAGRTISGANRKTLTAAANGMAEAMKAMKEHHGSLVDLLKKTDPENTRMNTQMGVVEDGGKAASASDATEHKDEPTPRRSAAMAATTPGDDSDTGISALLAELDGVLASHRK